PNSEVHEQESRFGLYSFGQLHCLFKIEVLRLSFWRDHRIANGNTRHKPYYKIRKLAYVQAFKSIRANEHGEFTAGPEITRVKLDISQRDRGLVVMDIKSLIRPAHLIPKHDEKESNERKMIWVVNNRIDQET